MSDKIKLTPSSLDGFTRSHMPGLVYLDVHTHGERHAICGWVEPEIAKLVKDAPAMLELLRAIFAEYRSVWDGLSPSAPIPVEMLERARALVDGHK